MDLRSRVCVCLITYPTKSITTGVNREYLMARFHFELQLASQIRFDISQQLVQIFFRSGKDHEVIGITEIMLYGFGFLHPVVEITQVEIREILAEIVADRNAWRRVNDFIEQPKQVLVFQFLSK